MQGIDQQKINMLDNMLSKAVNIVTVTHMKPDGDALGSSLGMYHFLTAGGKKCRVVLPHRQPANLNFLLEGCPSEDVMVHETHPEKTAAALASADLIICLDFNAFHRTDKLEEHLASSKAAKILIDHHLSPDEECFDLVFSETQISSASELVFQILMATPQVDQKAEALPAKAAEALMTGMITDTNNFSNSVFPSTLRMTSSLLEAGTDRDAILARLYNCFGEKRLRLLGHMLKDLMTITPDGVAYMVMDKSTLAEHEVSEGDTEGFVNMPLSIAQVRMSILAKEDNDKLRISIRSKKGTSANRCSRLHFNGGGHENAAGGRLRIPEDVASARDAAAYIEEHTHRFFTEENEK